MEEEEGEWAERREEEKTELSTKLCYFTETKSMLPPSALPPIPRVLRGK